MSERYTCEKCDELVLEEDVKDIDARYVGYAPHTIDLLKVMDKDTEPKIVKGHRPTVKIGSGACSCCNTRYEERTCGPLRLETQEEYYVRMCEDSDETSKDTVRSPQPVRSGGRSGRRYC